LKHRFTPHPYYFEVVEAALDEAERLGLVIDLTISSSWPPGGTWVPREDSMRTLLMGSTVVNGGARIEMKAPGYQLPVFLKFIKFIKSGTEGASIQLHGCNVHFNP